MKHLFVTLPFLNFLILSKHQTNSLSRINCLHSIGKIVTQDIFSHYESVFIYCFAIRSPLIGGFHLPKENMYEFEWELNVCLWTGFVFTVNFFKDSLFTRPKINVGTRSHKEQYFICSLICDRNETLEYCTGIFDTGLRSLGRTGYIF